MNIKKCLFVIIMLLSISAAQANETVTGKVYHDANGNQQLDNGEAGIADVCVSNGQEVVKTAADGSYSLPASDDMIVFVVKPSGYATPVDANNLPIFSYVHKPAGSPTELQRFRGLEPTGDLPEAINFALYPIDEPEQFKVIVNGDSQVYNDREINYLRDSFVKDVKANHSDAAFCISMGDNLGDELALFSRYHAVMGEMDMPVYYVPGNHDMDFDVSRTADSFDTHKSYTRALYYSFNVGKVHFMIVNSVQYPSLKQGGSYNGEIDEIQMEWIANDLAMTPSDMLIVMNMHIPVVSDVDRMSSKHQVDNREDLYALVEGRKVLTMGGHTHTLSHFEPGDELEGWGQPTPIHQIIVGAACGSWWSGDLDDALVPTSYQRCGTPRNYLVFEFDGNTYKETFKGSLLDSKRQMHMAFMTDGFIDWLTARQAQDANETILGLNDRYILSQDDLQLGSLIVNFYAGGNSSTVTCEYDNGEVVEAVKTLDVIDPYALANQMYVLRGVPGFKLWDAPSFGGTSYGPGAPTIDDSWMQTVEGKSTHLWICDIPETLESGVHTVTVKAVDIYGVEFEDKMVFEVE